MPRWQRLLAALNCLDDLFCETRRDEAPARRPFATQIDGKLIAVDPVKKTITLKGPKGNIVELEVQNQDHFKVVKAGNPVSYGATWAPTVDTRVVTVPIGYGDGYPRSLSSTGEVLIRGARHPIVGRICMDQFMVDIGQGSAWNEDEVVLIGAQGGDAISVETVAQWAGTIPYEILVGLNDRIPREYRGGAARATDAAAG